MKPLGVAKLFHVSKGDECLRMREDDVARSKWLIGVAGVSKSASSTQKRAYPLECCIRVAAFGRLL